MNNRIIQGMVVNLCLMFSSTLIYANENHLVNFLEKVAHGTQDVAKGILHGTEKIFEPPKETPPPAVKLKKETKPAKKPVKKSVKKPTTIAQQSNTAPADASSQTPAANASSQTPAADASSQTPAADASGSTPPADAVGGGNTNIPEVAEPGIQVPNDNQLSEPPQTNDTTTGITGGESY